MWYSGVAGIAGAGEGNPGFTNCRCHLVLVRSVASERHIIGIVKDEGYFSAMSCFQQSAQKIGDIDEEVHVLQAGVEGLLTLVSMVDRNDIVKVEIKMPGDNVRSFSDAKMPALNLRYLCAVILEDGELTFEMAASRERMATDAIKQRMETVALTHDPQQEREHRVESALVEVTLRSGETKQIFIEHVLGFPNVLWSVRMWMPRRWP